MRGCRGNPSHTGLARVQTSKRTVRSRLHLKEDCETFLFGRETKLGEGAEFELLLPKILILSQHFDEGMLILAYRGVTEGHHGQTQDL